MVPKKKKKKIELVIFMIFPAEIFNLLFLQHICAYAWINMVNSQGSLDYIDNLLGNQGETPEEQIITTTYEVNKIYGDENFCL